MVKCIYVEVLVKLKRFFEVEKLFYMLIDWLWYIKIVGEDSDYFDWFVNIWFFVMCLE